MDTRLNLTSVAEKRAGGGGGCVLTFPTKRKKNKSKNKQTKTDSKKQMIQMVRKAADVVCQLTGFLSPSPSLSPS